MPTATTAGHGTEIAITGFAFAATTVAAGGKVRWRNNDPNIHMILSDTAGSPPDINTPIPTGGLSAPVTMPIAGVYNYHCGVHAGLLGAITITP